MIKRWVIDLRHYLQPNGNIAPLSPRGFRLAQFWANMVSEATQFDEPTTLRCWRRPGRRLCGELLTIFFDIDNDDVLWFCPRCQDEGRISGWQGTFWDHSG
jgi:hypothetical protein